MNNDNKNEKKSITLSLNKNNHIYNIQGDLIIQKDSKGLVIFAHGSDSGMHSPRNQYVAKVLNNYGISTLLLDLLIEDEEKVDDITKEHRFDIGLLADRLISITDGLLKQENTNDKILGYFGASTGAAASLIAADKRSENVSAIISIQLLETQ